MKYIINENNLQKIINNYLNSLPELQNLSLVEDNFFDWDSGVSVDVIFFESEPDIPQMEYYPVQSNTEGWSDSDLEGHPLLKINIETNLDKIIGEGVEKYVKDWFEKIYNLPVKTILF